jgi:hypothetical protein
MHALGGRSAVLVGQGCVNNAIVTLPNALMARNCAVETGSSIMPNVPPAA